MADNNTDYECDCVYHRHGYILCDQCKEWLDKVDKAVEKHRVDTEATVTTAKRWINSSKK